MTVLVYGSLPPEELDEGFDTILKRLQAATPCLSGAERLRVFNALPAWMQKLAWLELEAEARR